MRTVELRKFEAMIADKQQTIRKGSAKLLKDIYPEVLAFKTLEVIDTAMFKDDNPFLILTPLAGKIGKSVVQDELLIDQVRIGIWLLDILAKYGVIKRVKFRSGKQEHSIRISDMETFVKMTFAMPLNLPNNPVHTRPILTAPIVFSGYTQYQNAINKQKSTRFSINTALLDIYNQMDIDVVANLKGKILDSEQKTSIYRAANETLRQASILGDEPFWTQCYYDFRGRMYQSTAYINYGSTKLAKSLFLLDPKPLGEDGVRWLKINIASLWKWDKESLDRRVELVDEKLEEFMIWAEDPLNYLAEIKQADDPYCFLAGIMEYLKFWLTGDITIESGLPIAQDMTNSGAQIMSLLSRDKETGALCNLLPESSRGDLYLYIADNVELFNSDPYWHKHKADRRAIVKRSVMTYNYSCGARTMADHIMSDFGNQQGFEALTVKNCRDLGTAIYKACRELMPGTTKMMDRFVKYGCDLAKNNQQIDVVMPTGFRFRQRYFKPKTKQINVSFNGERLQLRVIVKQEHTLWKSKIKSASSPNIVHAFDASLLSFIITRNDYDKLVIHDAFAAVASDSQQLYEDTRQAAIELFSEDQLDKVFGINDVEMGDLDISGVADNQYFCS